MRITHFSRTLLYLTLATLLIPGCANNQSASSTSAVAVGQSETMTASDRNRYHLALEALSAGNQTDAARAIRSLTDSYPEHVALWINLAAAQYQLGKLNQAEAALERAGGINPSIPDIHNLRGLIAAERGEYQAAEQYYLAALNLDSTYAYAHYNLALLYDTFHQNIPRAVSHYDHYLSLTDSEDKDTANWVEQLRLTLDRGNQ